MLDRLNRLPKPVLLIGAYALTAALGAADYQNGDAFSLALFYLPMISFVCWTLGLSHAIVLSFVSAAIWLYVDIYAPRGTFPRFHHCVDAALRFLVFVAFAMVLARLKASLDRERELARIDFLTGLYNGVAFFELAEAEMARAHRYSRPVSIVFLDCDNFKKVNDTRGHAEGDRVLRAIGKTLRAASRATDVIARMGGDEFVLLLPETDQSAAQAAVRKTQRELEEEMRRNGWPITFSIGVATFKSPTGSVSDMIREADDLMYSVKLSSKNSAQFKQVG